jgi:chemotaxis protein CheZ
MAASNDFTVEKAKGLMLVCGKFAERSAKFAEGQSAALSDIMMAQDFQDLSGQVIKKVINIITRTELQLVHLLMESAPESLASAAAEVVTTSTAADPVTVDNHKLEGPQTAGTALQQGDVDDLLASLGF